MDDVVQQQSEKEAARSLVLVIARALLDEPGEVNVDVRSSEIGTTHLLKVAAEDLGKVIGKQGRTARSVRIILGVAG